MKRRFTISVAAAGLGALMLPQSAAAHGLVGRTDLPIPAWLFGWAAVVVLIISFVALAALWPKPRLQRVVRKPLFRMPALVDPLCGALGVGMFVLVVYSGLRGAQDATVNILPTVVYVHFWVGFAIANALFGNVFRAFNPWLALARAYAWVVSKVAGGPVSAPFKYPEWLGCWPAVVGLFEFAWLELVYVDRTDPSTLALIAVAYAAVQMIGMGLFGIESWSRRGDAFGVYFGLFARLSPFQRSNGVLELRRPLSGAPQLEILPGTIALLLVSIGSTSFDGASNGPLWASVSPHLQEFFFNLGASPKSGLEEAFSVGLVTTIGIVSGFYMLGIWGMRSVGGGFEHRDLAGRFVHTLIPIALAYVVAHYFSLFAYQGQALISMFSDPLGHGSNFFGTAHRTIDYSVISSTGIWYVQVAALVSGHVAGLVLAHDRALALYPDTRNAVRSQYWMLVVMIGFTSLGLWLLSSIGT